jgi:hypothetical protein
MILISAINGSAMIFTPWSKLRILNYPPTSEWLGKLLWRDSRYASVPDKVSKVSRADLEKLDLLVPVITGAGPPFGSQPGMEEKRRLKLEELLKSEARGF